MNSDDLDSFYSFDRQTQEPYIQGAILNHSDLIAGEDISKREFDVRVKFAKSPHEIRHNLLSSCRDESNADTTEPARGCPLSFLARRFQLFQSNGRVLLEDSSGLGERSALSISVQELHFEFVLKSLDLQAERGLAQMKKLCAPAEVERVCNGKKRTNLADFHDHS